MYSYADDISPKLYACDSLSFFEDLDLDDEFR